MALGPRRHAGDERSDRDGAAVGVDRRVRTGPGTVLRGSDGVGWGRVTMAPATVAIVVAVLSAALALTSAVTVEMIRRRANERIAESRKRDEIEREARTRGAQLAELVRSYEQPLLNSAYDLQSRLFNLHRGFRGRRDEGDYFRSNTLYVIAEYFGWLEIVRREMQFLDLGKDGDSARLKAALDRVQDTFAETSRRYTDHLYIYRGQQRAIGELMIVELDDPVRPGRRSICMGYATFAERHTAPPLAPWLSRIDARIADLTGPDLVRLVEVQHALIDLIDLVDPARVRFPANRDKIATLS